MDLDDWLLLLAGATCAPLFRPCSDDARFAPSPSPAGRALARRSSEDMGRGRNPSPHALVERLTKRPSPHTHTRTHCSRPPWSRSPPLPHRRPRPLLRSIAFSDRSGRGQGQGQGHAPGKHTPTHTHTRTHTHTQTHTATPKISQRPCGAGSFRAVDTSSTHLPATRVTRALAPLAPARNGNSTHAKTPRATENARVIPKPTHACGGRAAISRRTLAKRAVRTGLRT